jgi:hypothetical protein
MDKAKLKKLKKQQEKSNKVIDWRKEQKIMNNEMAKHITAKDLENAKKYAEKIEKEMKEKEV